MNSEYKSVLKQFLSEMLTEKAKMAANPGLRDICLKTAGI